MIVMMMASADLAAATPAATSGCAVAAPLLAAGRTCAEANHGIVIAVGDARARARQLADLANEGERRFVLRFGRTVPRYAVIERDGTPADGVLGAALKQAGFVWRLPWLSERAMADGYRSSITRAVTAKADALHLDADRRDAMIATALTQQAAASDPASLRRKEAGALPHELGHGWFIRAFWPEAGIDTQGHYGGPAPDWMDETAAVMMEDDAFADGRRRQFAAIYAGADAAARAKLVDLALFLSGGHPALPGLAALGPAAKTGGITVLTGAEAAGIAAAANGFYLQARLFADYVLDRSGDPTAFRLAADAFAKGLTTTQWLARDGARLHLPSTPAALQRDWSAWLAARHRAATVAA